MRPINVISLFDGKACARVALERAGIPVANYYASEIDKYAMIIAKKNYPNIQHVGDVTKLQHVDWTGIDLLCGGSPCQGFSFAGKQLNFNDPRSALFFEFVRIWNEIKAINPNAKFFLENVVMKQEYQDIISGLLGVKPVMVNSALVSAQNRKRLYWTNIEGFVMPKDMGILLKDILEKNINKYIHSEAAVRYMEREVSGGRNHYDFKHHSDTNEPKSSCVTANIFKGVPYNVIIDRISDFTKRDFTFSISKSSNIRPHRFDEKKSGISEVGTILNVNNKSVTITTSHQPKVYTENPFCIRKLTPIECERLQTLPDNYTQGVSDSQRYKMIGNGWTIDVIVEFFKNLKPDTDFSENLDF